MISNMSNPALQVVLEGMKTGGSDAAGKEKATAPIKPWQSSNSECRTLSELVYTYGAFALVWDNYSASSNTLFHIFCEAWSPPRLHSRVLPLRAL